MRYFLLLLLSIPLWARAQAPQWSAPNGSAFSYSANLTAVLELDGQVSLSANDQLAAFVGDEIRGKAMAVDLNGKVLHFMTIFSNVPTGEEIELRAYIAADDEVYTSISSFVFDQSSVTGSASTPYSVQLSSDGDLLISLDSLPTQARLQGLSFFPVPLRDYLNQADADPVSWSVSNSLYFQHLIAGDTLFLSVVDPDWTGTDTLTITATEQTVNAYSASQNLVLTVEPGLNGPAFDSIPVQSVVTGQPFPSLMLGDYESSYTGNCLSYSYKPVPAIGMPEQQASWVIGGGGWPFTMSVLATTTYSPSFLFQSDEDKLGAFIGGELRGAASAQIINGQRLFTMQVYHTAIDGEIEFRYFSDSLKRIFVLPDTFDFVSGGQLGTPSQPQILDFSPLSYTLDSQTGALSVGLRVPGWEGVEEVQFRASDCSYPAELQDTVTVLFCSGPDTDGDGLCDQLDPDPDDACNPDALNGNCDADGDGVYADADPDDGDPCNPLIEVEVLSAAGPSCPEATDGHVEIGLTTPYCSGGRFDVYLEEASLPVQQLGSGQLLPDTFRVESLGAGTYSLRIELSEAGSCTYSSSCFPFITDSLAQLVSQDSLSPALFVDAGSGALPASDTLQYFAGPEACGLSLSWQAEVSDNCTAPPLQYSVSCEGCSEAPEAAITGSTLSLFAGVGANQLELWATDADSNSIRHTYVLMVQDTVPPQLSCTAHTVYLDGDGIGSIVVADIDGGSNDACGLDTLFLSQTVFGCSDVGPNTVTLTGVDNNDNEAFCTATVTVLDSIAPQLLCTGYTVYLDEEGIGSIAVGDIDGGSNDACGLDTLFLSQTVFGCSDVGPNTVTLTGVDKNDNESFCTATVTVLDSISPQLLCTAHTVYLDGDGIGSIVVADIDGGSNDACGLDTLFLSRTVFGCSDVGPNTVTLTGVDNNDNESFCTATVTVLDSISPQLLCTGHTIYLDGDGIGSIAVGDIDGGSNDACGLDTLFLSQTVFGCSDVGPNTVTLTGVDNNDNESFCTATVTVLDSIAPQLLCTGQTIYLDEEGIGSIAVGDIDGGSNDACGLDTLFLSRTVFGCSDVGELPVTLTGVDENGNSGTCTATIAVRDTVGPVMLCQSRTVTLSVFGTGSLSAAHVNAGSNDACGAVSLSLSQSSFDCGDVGVQSVTLTGTDVNGNSSSCEAQVTVEDLSSPSVLCSSPEVQVSYDGTYELLLSDVYAGGFDACGIDTILYDAAIYTCEDIGSTYEVQVTSIDVNGNESSCTSTVSVQQSPGLPPEWSVTGLNGSPGSATWDICTDNGTLNLWSGGYHSGSGGSPDGYLFVHQPFCASKGGLQLDLGTVSGDSYIGLSVRSSLLPDAAMVGLYWNGSGLLRWEVRGADGALREVTLLDAPNAKKIRLEYFNGTWRGRYQILGAGWLNLAAVSIPQPSGSCFEVGVGGFTVDPSGSMSGSVSKVRVVVLEQQVWSPPVTNHTSGPGNGLIIWPNPTAGAAVLEWAVPLEAGAEVRIYGPLGQLALPVQQAVAGQQQLKLDMERLPAGVYTVQCRSAGAQGRQTLKLVRY